MEGLEKYVVWLGKEDAYEGPYETESKSHQDAAQDYALWAHHNIDAWQWGVWDKPVAVRCVRTGIAKTFNIEMVYTATEVG